MIFEVRKGIILSMFALKIKDKLPIFSFKSTIRRLSYLMGLQQKVLIQLISLWKLQFLLFLIAHLHNIFINTENFMQINKATLNLLN